MELNPWNVSPKEAVQIQLRLREQLILEPPPKFTPELIAGADISVALRGKRGFAGIAVLRVGSLQMLEGTAAAAELNFPYVPGLLSFRELPPLLAAWQQLRQPPDVLIFDGHGTAHPRRFGLACHGGMVLGVPTIGCAKSLLVGEHAALGTERGSTADLVHRDEVVGRAVRTRSGVKPVYVSPGHRMDLDTAVRLVLQVSQPYREPETTRRAHQLVNQLRRAAEVG